MLNCNENYLFSLFLDCTDIVRMLFMPMFGQNVRVRYAICCNVRIYMLPFFGNLRGDSLNKYGMP